MASNCMPRREGDNAVLSFPLEAHGYGAILAVRGNPDAKLTDLMAKMKAMTAKPLSSYLARVEGSAAATGRDQSLPSPRPPRPKDMIRIAGGDYDFKVEGIEIEGHNDVGVDVQYPWEKACPPLPRTPDERQALLHRQVSRHQCGVQEIPRCDPLSSRRRSQLSQGLEGRQLSGRLGQQAGHLGVAGGCARLCQMGRKAPSS